jgi:hypothetical protein
MLKFADYGRFAVDFQISRKNAPLALHYRSRYSIRSKELVNLVMPRFLVSGFCKQVPGIVRPYMFGWQFCRPGMPPKMVECYLSDSKSVIN